MDAAPSRRRWFRFSLRTLLIVMAALSAAGGYVTHEWRIVQEREAASRQACDEGGPKGYRLAGRVSLVRRLLGDRGYEFMCFVSPLTEKTRARLSAAYPEAVIYRNSRDIPPFPATH